MVILKLTDGSNGRGRTCTLTRDGVMIGRVTSRKPELLDDRVRHMLRIMKLPFPIQDSAGVWVILEPGDD